MTTVNIDGKDYTPEEVLTLAKAGVLSTGAKHDTSSATPNATPTHGPYPGNNAMFGLFSDPGVRPGMWNATPRVRSISQFIPMYKSLIFNEKIEVATGVTIGSGENQTSACIVGPKPGQLKKARIDAEFGIIHESTKIADVTQAGLRRDRADVDREFYNTVGYNNPWLPRVPGIEAAGAFNSLMRTEVSALGVDLERNTSQVHYTGVSGTEDNTYRGVARQWDGFDRLVRNTWTDSNGVTIPMLGAAVTSFNAAIAGGTDVLGRGVVASIVDTYYGQVDFLRSLGINPLFVLTMRPELARALAAVWACSYGTDRCYNATDAKPMIRSADQVQRNYEDIMANMYLPLDGSNIKIVIDDAIPQQTLGNGYYKSDVYGLMLQGNGRPTIYGEYFDMDNPQAMEIINFAGMGGDETATVNDGMYRVFKRVTGGCYEYDFFARVRLITDAPFSHFRIDDLFYNSFYRSTPPIPGFSDFRNGGNTYSS